MKRYSLFISLLLLVTFSSFGQSSILVYPGGNITSTTDWNIYDTVYVTGDVMIQPGGTLNISPNTSGTDIGTYIVFTGPYWINIAGSGVINVNGTIAERIFFTADRQEDATQRYGDKVFGETGERWQNISFDITTGTSVIDYAVLEWGTGDGYFLGGGIDIYGDNITVRNSEIRYCTSDLGDGGGIFAFGNNISLLNLKVHHNSASGNGGGIYLDGSINISGCEIYNNTAASGDGVFFETASTISNSLIYNHSTGEGIYAFASAGTSVRNCVIHTNATGIYFYYTGNVVNCDIVNNTTGVTSATATAPILVNSILWGNTTEYNLTSGANIELAYCGIEGGFTVGTNGGGNINLSSTNGADSGPNFLSTSTPDYHINSWITPLVDGGTSASYSGITIPATDIESRSRIGSTDIGAYEFVYFIWTGNSSTDWSTPGNWVGSPSSITTSITDNRVIIPAGRPNYPTASSLTLSTRSTLTIEPLAGLTVAGSTSVGSGCSFLLQSNVTGSANFITGSSVSGNFDVELFLAGGGSPNYRWHYVTTPINGISKSVLTTGISTDNLLNYIESKVTTDMNAGWNWHDDGTNGFTTLLYSRGYNVYVPTDQTALFTGTVLYNQSRSFSLECGTTNPTHQGWNLIGNPFTSGVNADALTYGSNVLPVAYFTKDNGYSSYNWYTHASIGGATPHIPPLQGFFVHATSGRNRTLVIPASSREYSASPIYKGTQVSYDYPVLKLNVSDGGTFTDETLVYFFKDASLVFDGNYDAYKMLSDNPVSPQIYTISDNIKLGMNGLPFPDKITEVPLKIRIGEAKNYTINVLNLDNLTDCKVTLVHGDKKIDLKNNPNYTFFASIGTIDNMSLIFDMSLTDVTVPSGDNTICWYSNGVVSIKAGQPGFEDNSSVIICDLNGKVVYNKNNITLNRGEIINIPVNLANGFYITTVLNKNRKLSKKIVVTY
jgi:hypothetical protein